MAIPEEELKKEKAYLRKVKKIIRKEIADSDTEIERQKKDIYEMKKFMWENASDFTDEEIMVEMYNRDQEVGLTNARIDSLVRLKKSLQSPYFGKILFESDSFDKVLPVYLGINSIIEGKDFYVFDWRSPVSSMFYNYELGEAEYDAPMGKIKGNILNKRQFKIEDGKIVRCFDSAINIDDDFLQEVLSQESSEKMQNIVSTIQKEQNEIIRNINDKFLIVQGVAGSGKTSVALHRIAYLLYKYKNLNSRNVLIFSPNNLFSYYISDVLPDLGEENVMTTTFYDFSKSILNCKNVESFTSYLERSYQGVNSDENAVIKRKMSDDFKNELDSFYDGYISKLRFAYRLSFGNRVVPTSLLNNLFHQKWNDRNVSTRLDFITGYICDEYRVAKKARNKIYNALLKSLNNKIDVFSIYNSLLEKEGFDTIKQDNIMYEDISPLIYLYFKMNDIPNYSAVKQVVIDEAQDYSKLQIEILNKLFPNASFTILGDVNQTINPNYKYDSLASLKDVHSKSNYLELNKTYRSSQEIIDYSNKVLGLDNVCVIRHDNSIPVTEMNVEREDIAELIPKALFQLNDNGFKKNAIVTKNKDEALYLSRILKDEKNLSLVKDSGKASMNGNIIIPSYMSKGLEFDGVIVYTDKNNQYTEEERNLYYVVLSRAQHQLIVCNQDKVKTR